MIEYEAFTDFVIFKTDTLFNSHVKFKGLNGRDLVLDTSFDPQRHSRLYGEVVSVPGVLTGKALMQESIGMPAYHEKAPFNYKFLCDIPMDIKPGDRIYYHFNTIKPNNIIKEEGVHPNKTWYIKVRYDNILCTVRTTLTADSVVTDIIPIGGYTLIDPDFESWDDILKPTYSNIMGEDGKPMLKPKEQWLQTKVAPSYKYLTGFVKHVGKPLIGDETEIEVGQKIWYRINADWQVKIEERDYFVVRQRHIIGKEVDGKFVPTRGYMLVVPIKPGTLTPVTGLTIPEGYVKRGYVHIPGRNKFEVGQLVDFGQSHRTEIILNGQKYLHIQGADCFAHKNV
jgi:co-chaperonin GroES (HSP10)